MIRHIEKQNGDGKGYCGDHYCDGGCGTLYWTCKKVGCGWKSYTKDSSKRRLDHAAYAIGV